tara:strand:+ start:1068 stop:1580 length:513 start_codon:yes stop_codon:yes gene_type:complete
MGLEQIATGTISGTSTKTLDLVGTTTDDVYMVVFNNVSSTTNDDQIRIRVLVSSSADDSSEYDNSNKGLIDNEGFPNNAVVNQNAWNTLMFTGDQTGETQNGVVYLYNFNKSSEYSFIQHEIAGFMHTPRLYGTIGGGVQTENQACNGIQFFANSGNLSNGSKFTLYKVI